MKKEGVEPTSSVERAKELRTNERYLDTVDMDQVHQGGLIIILNKYLKK